MRILVTAGPTREYLDTVRFLSNSSSGKFGYHIASEASRRGHHVVLISGPVATPEPKGVTVKHVTTAREMFAATRSAFKQSDALIMTAAVCDYRPARRINRKLKKQARSRVLRLEPTEDILAHLGKVKGNRVVLGFAMEDHDQRQNAERKLRRKRCDAMVLNGPSNVGGDAAEIQVFRADSGWGPLLRGTKAQLAKKILDLAESMVRRREKL